MDVSYLEFSLNHLMNNSLRSWNHDLSHKCMCLAAYSCYVELYIYIYIRESLCVSVSECSVSYCSNSFQRYMSICSNFYIMHMYITIISSFFFFFNIFLSLPLFLIQCDMLWMILSCRVGNGPLHRVYRCSTSILPHCKF